jgi:hypothetical protein
VTKRTTAKVQARLFHITHNNMHLTILRPSLLRVCLVLL